MYLNFQKHRLDYEPLLLPETSDINPAKECKHEQGSHPLDRSRYIVVDGLLEEHGEGESSGPGKGSEHRNAE